MQIRQRHFGVGSDRVHPLDNNTYLHQVLGAVPCAHGICIGRNGGKFPYNMLADVQIEHEIDQRTFQCCALPLIDRET